jgi:hypothetical protein
MSIGCQTSRFICSHSSAAARFCRRGETGTEKRAKLVQTRSELERFQISSNDFNCSMRLNDSDGNVFTTSF